MTQAFIHGYKTIEMFSRQCKQFSIFPAVPAHLTDRFGFVADQQMIQRTPQTFVQQNFHAAALTSGSSGSMVASNTGSNCCQRLSGDSECAFICAASCSRIRREGGEFALGDVLGKIDIPSHAPDGRGIDGVNVSPDRFVSLLSVISEQFDTVSQIHVPHKKPQPDEIRQPGRVESSKCWRL